MFESILNNVQEKTPLIHCITNYVTVNDVANVLLACGGSPTMADDESDAVEITAICHGLVINIGTLNQRTISAMLKVGKKANELSHPVVLDPVGAGASKLRTDTTFKLLEEVKFSVIRGNISEIKTVAKGSGTTRGVDADASDAVTEENLDEAISFAKELSASLGSIIAITGAIDLVADADKAYIIRNGHQMMAKITGSGCMLTAVIAAYCAANPGKFLDATSAAVCAFGLCGELAYDKVVKNDGGTASYRTYLIDAVSKMDWKTLKEGMKIETR
ncbi:MAG: hydroxyethylthiazole kinase [Firmicutes bacterium]|jgi:hydroxyethylthiazole kinase|nr:hydroxyethylthiazole kinase [Bacillota bacterium]HQD39346.1 hydroxyethylthiazole kinase [Bacillota bacterium]